LNKMQAERRRDWYRSILVIS